MTHESCIKHPARNPTIVLRNDYLRLCDGDGCAAHILSQHEHWHNIKLDSRQQANEHNQAAKRAAEVPTQDTELWVYMSQIEMKKQLMLQFGDKAIMAGYKLLLEKGFLQKRTNPKYTWDKTLQYLLVIDKIQTAIDALELLGEDADTAEIYDGAELQDSKAQKCGLDTAEVRHAERKDAASKTQKCATPKTSTKTTISETSAKTTTKNPPLPPEVPSPSTSGEEEEDLSSASEVKDKAAIKNETLTDDQQRRVEDMLEKIAKITGTSIDLEKLRPLALECVQREHKDAWLHTLSVMTSKMAETVKPKIPNRFAATVLKNALESPAPKKFAPKPVAATVPSVTVATPPVVVPEPQAPPVDAPATWAIIKAMHELSKPWFKAKHGRASSQDDWTARAKEIAAAGENPADH